MSLSIKAFQSLDETLNISRHEKMEEKKNGKTLFAGNLGIGAKNQSPIEQKREKAREQAMKLIRNAWDNDDKSAKNIDDLHQLKSDKLSEAKEAKAAIQEIDDYKAKLQMDYGIDSDSQEQKDLELLEKFQDYMSGAGAEPFTKEEVERLKELQNVPRTEYQNSVLKQNGLECELKVTAKLAKMQTKGIIQSITNAEIEQLKSQGMIKAQNAADDIMDATGDEILGLLLQEGKEKLDEEMEEEKEKAEKVEEKKEEQDERLEEAKENRKEQEELINNAVKADQIEMNTSVKQTNTSNVQEALKTIQKVLEENDLLDDDLKGIKIDFNF